MSSRATFLSSGVAARRDGRVDHVLAPRDGDHREGNALGAMTHLDLDDAAGDIGRHVEQVRCPRFGCAPQRNPEIVEKIREHRAIRRGAFYRTRNPKALRYSFVQPPLEKGSCFRLA